ncbi:hypothetical protein GCM10025880_37760 [Methylorubrum aminovorans]|nr:hypothetical protein GCM10025880_37760 [Methylorubrum aminovorans]
MSGAVESIVIVGAGQAGFQAAASLREAGFAGSLTLIGEEAALPYQRPPLSKAYLAGKTDARGLLLRQESYFAEHRIDHRSGTRVTAIGRAERRVQLSDGGHLAYDHLILATGTRNRALPVPGADLAGVRQLRSSTMPMPFVPRSRACAGSWWWGPASSAWNSRRSAPPEASPSR